MSNSHLKITVSPEEVQLRIDRFLANHMPDVTRNHVMHHIDKGFVLINGKVIKPSYRLRLHDVIEVLPWPVELTTLIPKAIPLNIVYEDADIIVINKPQGMVVHPSPGHYEDTLVHALLHHCKDLSGINGEMRPGIVHRIDKDTSGLLVVAKHDTAHVGLAKQLEDHSLSRVYTALVSGVIREQKGKIIAPIGRDPDDRVAMDVIAGGKEAVTHFTVIERFQDHTLLHVELETGRTHQIRVHMKFIHHPIESDPVYNLQKHALHARGQMLHASQLTLRHPTTHEIMTFTAPLPDYFERILKKLRG
jgi:23S rRNA pseudouridine1911/1915/1917 synthase